MPYAYPPSTNDPERVTERLNVTEGYPTPYYAGSAGMTASMAHYGSDASQGRKKRAHLHPKAWLAEARVVAAQRVTDIDHLFRP